MPLSPTSHKVGSARACRKAIDNEQLASGSRLVNHTGADHATYPEQEASTSLHDGDLPFRTIEWGGGNGVAPSSNTARLTSLFEDHLERSPAYAPTGTTTDLDAATPRFMPPFTASALPSYVRSASAPTKGKRRSESCLGDVAPPGSKIKKEQDPSPPPQPERRASAANEGHHRASSQQFESWRKKRKEQKIRLRREASRYAAEQESLFKAHRAGHDAGSPTAGDGEKAVKPEPGEDR
ncbi:MAG: hypothetical protein LQ349_003954 [Xanthoria aureola]|nr:MAG: hypothetical protein LQ349_003954 [Xanthoria aureola]